jgi:hypothetical protein
MSLAPLRITNLIKLFIFIFYPSHNKIIEQHEFKEIATFRILKLSYDW